LILLRRFGWHFSSYQVALAEFPRHNVLVQFLIRIQEVAFSYRQLCSVVESTFYKGSKSLMAQQSCVYYVASFNNNCIVF
jgi:hypothetical protein